MAAVTAFLLDTLSGVGDTTRVDWEWGDYALHLRRPLTDAEYRALPRRKAAPTFPIETAR